MIVTNPAGYDVLCEEVARLGFTSLSQWSNSPGGQRVHINSLLIKPKACELQPSEYWTDEYAVQWNRWAAQMFGSEPVYMESEPS